MDPIPLQVNGRTVNVETEADTPLLWVLREQLALTGTKFGCGIAACGACTVLLDGQAVRSCVLPVSAVGGRAVRTIESAASDRIGRALQDAWVAHNVPQCGYCQSGQIMAASALLATTPQPGDADIDAAMRNLCRCGTYQRIRVAIRSAARALQGGTAAPPAPPAETR